MDSEAVSMIIVLPLFFLVSGWAFKTLVNYYQNRHLAKLHYSLQDKVLDKIGSSPEAVEYLRSGAGEKLVAQLSRERTSPYQRILTALQVGAVISLLSIGFLYLRSVVTDEGAEAFTVIGVLGLALGVGFLVSAGAAYFFSKNWGLINGSSDADA
jgi:hypothetical protein